MLDGEDLLIAVRDSIEAQERWVLILDNADDLELFGVSSVTGRLKSLLDFVPRVGTGTVLWMSRDERIVGTLVGSLRGIQVARMTPNEARELLSATRNDRTEIPETDVLLEELQCLPLAISQAGALYAEDSYAAAGVSVPASTGKAAVEHPQGERVRPPQKTRRAK